MRNLLAPILVPTTAFFELPRCTFDEAKIRVLCPAVTSSECQLQLLECLKDGDAIDGARPRLCQFLASKRASNRSFVGTSERSITLWVHAFFNVFFGLRHAFGGVTGIRVRALNEHVPTFVVPTITEPSHAVLPAVPATFIPMAAFLPDLTPFVKCEAHFDATACSIRRVLPVLASRVFCVHRYIVS